MRQNWRPRLCKKSRKFFECEIFLVFVLVPRVNESRHGAVRLIFGNRSIETESVDVICRLVCHPFIRPALKIYIIFSKEELLLYSSTMMR